MKNKLMGFVALASCVVLSGCGSKDIKIEIKDIPTNLIAGDKIDLKNYITVSGGDGGYSINFDDESFSKITKESETEIVLNEYGSVKFTVDYSGISEEGVINVGSKFLAQYLEDSKDVVYDYAAISFDDYGYLDSWCNYGKNYLVNYTFADDGQYYIPGGYLEASDGLIYSFQYSGDDEIELDFSVTGGEPDSMEEVSMPYCLPRSDFEVKTENDETTGESYEYLIYSKNDNGELDNIFSSFFGIDLNVLKQYGYTASSVLVVEDELTGFAEDGSAMKCYDFVAMAKNSKGSEVYVYDVDVTFDQNAFFDEPVKDYIKSGETPKSKYSFATNDLKNAIDTHNFTVDYAYSWYECSVNEQQTDLIRGDAIDYNPFVDETSEGRYINEYLNATGAFKAYVTDKQTFVDVTKEPAYGMVEDANEHGWTYEYDSEKSAYLANSNTELSLFHELNNGHFENYEFLSGCDINGEGTVYDSFFVNDLARSVVGNTTTYKYSLSGKTTSDLFYILFVGAVKDGSIDWQSDEYSFKDVDTISLVADFLYEQYMDEYLDVTIEQKYESNVLKSVYYEFVWIDAKPVYNTSGAVADYEYFEYVMSANVTFGGTTIPAGVDVVYPD